MRRQEEALDTGAEVAGAAGEGVEGEVLGVARAVVAVERPDYVGEEGVEG